MRYKVKQGRISIILKQKLSGIQDLSSKNGENKNLDENFKNKSPVFKPVPKTKFLELGMEIKI